MLITNKRCESTVWIFGCTVKQQCCKSGYWISVDNFDVEIILNDTLSFFCFTVIQYKISYKRLRQWTFSLFRECLRENTSFLLTLSSLFLNLKLFRGMYAFAMWKHTTRVIIQITWPKTKRKKDNIVYDVLSGFFKRLKMLSLHSDPKVSERI